jgi:hypothetical protein
LNQKKENASCINQVSASQQFNDFIIEKVSNSAGYLYDLKDASKESISKLIEGTSINKELLNNYPKLYYAFSKDADFKSLKDKFKNAGVGFQDQVKQDKISREQQSEQVK